MKVKYMGSADIKRLEPGETFGGQLPDPLDRIVEFNWDNHHVVDSESEDMSGLPEAFWTLLAALPEIEDVTNADVVPLNEAQRMWKGMKSPGDPEPAPQVQALEVAQVVSPEETEQVTSVDENAVVEESGVQVQNSDVDLPTEDAPEAAAEQLEPPKSKSRRSSE